MIDAAQENANTRTEGIPGAQRQDLGAETKVTMRSVFSSVAELERVKGFGAVEAGHQTLERLAEWLATEHAAAR
jgi:hypothetical protein